MAVDGLDELSRTSLRNAISNAMARIKREYYGKGPARARTFVYGRIVISVLDDVLTPVELTLKEGDRSALVRRTRLTFEDIMASTFTGQIEQLTGAHVVAYHSQIVFDPDMAIEVFVLDRPAYDGATRASGGRAEGELRAALANAMCRIVHEHWGKGPTRRPTSRTPSCSACSRNRSQRSSARSSRAVRPTSYASCGSSSRSWSTTSSPSRSRP